MNKYCISLGDVVFFLVLLCIPAISLSADEVVNQEQPPMKATAPQTSGPLTETSSEPLSATAQTEQPIQPKKHLVQAGDTLWSISTAYLTDPFYWPKVWDANQFIKNPDRIYPGSVITLPPPEFLKKDLEALTEPPMEATPPPEEPVGLPEADKFQTPEVALPTPSEPTITVEPQVESPLDPALLASVGYILAGDIGGSGVLVGAKDHKVLLGEGDVVYLKPGRRFSPKEGDHLLIYRDIRKVYHPKTGKYLGKLIVVLGKVEVLDVGKKITTAKILKSYNYILAGDPVAPSEAVRLPNLEKTPSGEGAQVKGYVVDVKEEKVAIAQFDVVYIDRGMRDSIGRGSSFKVIRDGERTPYFSTGGGVLLPARTIGELEVITVNDHTATAKVRKSSEPISRGDRIETLPIQ